MVDFGIFTKSEQSLHELLMKITETEKPRIVTTQIYSVKDSPHYILVSDHVFLETISFSN